MMRRLSTKLFVVSLTVGLLVAFILDLPRLVSGLAQICYHHHHHECARDAWQWALNARPHDLAMRFNRGVALYRLGEFSNAQADFSAASTSGDLTLSYPARYNLANSLVRLAEQKAPQDAPAADKLYLEAIEHYQQYLAQSPQDPDAQFNLGMAIAARNARATNPTQHLPTPERPPTGAVHAANSSSTQSAEATRVSQAGQVPAQRSPPDVSDASRDSRARTGMSREEAERMLSDKRGQEALPSSQPAASARANVAMPEKDW